MRSTLMRNNYLDQFETNNYHITLSGDETTYFLVNNHTGVVELESSMLPQVLANLYNFESVLDQAISQPEEQTEIPDNVFTLK